ncbi:MAG TPA: hypothetical protein VF181_00460 [Balneolaceae bacterium]
MIVSIGIGLCFGLIGLGILAMIFSGIQSLIKGKQDVKKIATMVVPFIVYGVAYVIVGGLAEAGIATMFVMLAFMVLAIILSGMRTTFNL